MEWKAVSFGRIGRNMRIPVGDLSQFGIIKDIRDNMLPPNAWTNGQNIHFNDGKVKTLYGGVRQMDPPPIPPYWLMYVYSPTAGDTWVAAGQTQVQAYQAGAWTNISRTTGGAYNMQKWNGGLLANIPVMNNGIDAPQAWLQPVTGTPLVDLPNWPATWRCQVMRSYLNFLVALNMTESGTRYVHRFRWSTPAQPGNVPVSWDDTDPTQQAGIDELSDVDSGPIIDGAILRDTFIIYKQRSTWGMRFTGGIYVMNIFPIFNISGILSQNCACSFGEPSQHFVFTGEDIITHDGQQRVSIVDKKLRRWIIANIDPQCWATSYVVPFLDGNEIWTCIPTIGNSLPNLAIIWNTIDGSIGYRTLRNAAFIETGIIPALATPWTNAVYPWVQALSAWKQSGSAVYMRNPLQADPVDVAIIGLNNSQMYLGQNYDCNVERTGLALSGVSSSGEPISNKDMRKLVRGMWISAYGGPFQVQIARQHEIDGPITWGATYPFQPGTDIYVGVMDDTADQACRLFGMRFLWSNQSSGQLDSIDLDIEPLGEW